MLRYNSEIFWGPVPGKEKINIKPERQEKSWRVKPSSITGCQDRRHQEHNGVNTRIGILKTHQSQETSEANEGAEEGELKRKLIPGVNIFWKQDCFTMAEHGSLWSLRQEILKKSSLLSSAASCRV